MVSLHVGQPRRELDDPLFGRTASGLAFTPGGLRLASRASDLDVELSVRPAAGFGTQLASREVDVAIGQMPPQLPDSLSLRPFLNYGIVVVSVGFAVSADVAAGRLVRVDGAGLRTQGPGPRCPSLAGQTCRFGPLLQFASALAATAFQSVPKP